MKTVKKEQPIMAFVSQAGWEAWLDKNHADSDGIWLKIFKKGSGVATVSYDEALDAALCYGWIDGQKKSFDEKAFLQKFTPRRPASTWSKRNIGHIDRLEKEGRMKPAGLRAVEAAKADGRWAQAYDSPGNMEIPADFLAELEKDPKAFAFFGSLNRANLYAIAWRLQTAKRPETREKRMKEILGMLSDEKKFHV